jgi:maleylacetoacetate isomerase
MILHGYWRSSAAYRVRIALNWKGIEAVSQEVDLRNGAHHGPDYLALNPQGLVPCLVDGPLVLTQSLAIIEYLEEIHPNPPLLPASPADRARVRAAALAIACDIHPLNNPRIMNYLRGEMGRPQDAIDAWIKHWIAEGFGPLEAMAGAPYLCGDAVTMADLCLVPQMYNARRFSVDLSPYPKLTAIEANLLALPAFDKARPENQPDAA